MLLQVIRAALLHGAVDPEEVNAIDMHGTGTPLGDPIEIGALASVLQVSVTACVVLNKCTSMLARHLAFVLTAGLKPPCCSPAGSFQVSCGAQ